MISFARRQVKAALKNFACDPKTADYIRTATVASVRTAGREALAEISQGDALVDEFWFEAEFFVQTMTPLYQLLRMGDGVIPCMSKFLSGFIKIPQQWDHIVELQEMVTCAADGEGWKTACISGRIGAMKEQAAKRLDYIWNPMMSAAYALDPEYRHVNLLTIKDGQILRDLNIMFKRLLIDHGNDSAAAILAAEEEPEGGPVGKAGCQFATYKSGKWEGAELLGYAKSISPADWWETYGIGMQELAGVAVRVTSKVPASAGAERNWSLYGGKISARSIL